MSNTKERGSLTWQLHAGSGRAEWAADGREHVFGTVSDPSIGLRWSVLKTADGAMSSIVYLPPFANTLFTFAPTEAERSGTRLRLEWDGVEVRLFLNDRDIARFTGGE